MMITVYQAGLKIASSCHVLVVASPKSSPKRPVGIDRYRVYGTPVFLILGVIQSK